MDVKQWFENGTGMKIKELRYLQAPPLPYNIFIDEQVHRGADLKNNIVEHNITIEHYSKTIDKTNEEIIESFLDKEQKTYDKDRDWLQNEGMFVTVYQLDTFLEKIRKEN